MLRLRVSALQGHTSTAGRTGFDGRRWRLPSRHGTPHAGPLPALHDRLPGPAAAGLLEPIGYVRAAEYEARRVCTGRSGVTHLICSPRLSVRLKCHFTDTSC